jgi:coproporphyrinogen III oxidase
MNDPGSTVRAYLQGLQQRIVTAATELDGKEFVSDAWTKAPGEMLQGDGITRIVEGLRCLGARGLWLLARAGPQALPPSATQHRPELAGAPFEAMGVSLVFHPRNPYVPTVHMNVRMISAGHPGQEPVCWFGGGMDLTPYYGFEEDARHFHTVCRDAVQPFGDDKYPRFKQWCDTYFFSNTATSSAAWAAFFLTTFPKAGLTMALP